jgi:hypothetical protein
MSIIRTPDKVHLLGGQTDFSSAFPIVKSLMVSVKVQKGGVLDQNPKELVFSMQNPPGEMIHCTNPKCSGGGLSIAEYLREMVARKETKRETFAVCKGRERMSRSTHRPCLAHFNAVIELAYEE